MVANKQINDSYYDTSIALLEQSIGHINETLIRFEKRLDERMDSTDKKIDKLDLRMDSMENRIDSKTSQIDSKIDKLDSRIDSNFKWLLGMLIAGLGSILGIMSHGFHWL